jgi:signal transduction histidine kinase
MPRRPAEVGLLARVAVVGMLTAWVVSATSGSGRPFVTVSAGLLAVASFLVQPRLPLLTLGATFGGLVVAGTIGGFDGPDDPFIVMILWASFGVGRYADLRHQPWAAAGVLLLLSLNLLSEEAVQLPAEIVFPVLYTAVPWLLGLAVQLAGSREREAHERAAEVIRSQDDRLRQAKQDERLRLARELHDVAAHTMSVVSLHAQVLRRRLEAGAPVGAEDARLIEHAAQEAMSELRRVVGVLRPTGGADDRSPQPSVGQVGDLVEECNRAGQEVSLVVEGSAVDPPPGVSLTAYRILQEALSNARRHGTGAATVALRWSERSLTIEVTNPVAERGRARAGAGYGLSGMRERADLYGGTVAAGPHPDGWRVEAQLPFDVLAIADR